MLILISRAASTLMNSVEVNWLPWSLLKISGGAVTRQRFPTASMQKSASSVIDTRQARTRRVNQSSTAARRMASLVAPLVRATMASARHRDVGDVHRPDPVGPGDGLRATRRACRIGMGAKCFRCGATALSILLFLLAPRGSGERTAGSRNSSRSWRETMTHEDGCPTLWYIAGSLSAAYITRAARRAL